MARSVKPQEHNGLGSEPQVKLVVAMCDPPALGHSQGSGPGRSLELTGQSVGEPQEKQGSEQLKKTLDANLWS